jgi:DNA-binding protein H-NS
MANKQSSLAPLAKSKIKARSAVKGLSVTEMEKLIANLTSILKSEKQKEAARSKAARQAKIAKIRALMEESGLSAADLRAAGGKAGRKTKKRKTRKVEPKYRLVVDGQEHLWSGRGRAPRVFKDYFDAGNSRDSCAI